MFPMDILLTATFQPGHVRLIIFQRGKYNETHFRVSVAQEIYGHKEGMEDSILHNT